MSEVRSNPIQIEDDDGVIYVCFTEGHTIRDMIRWMLSEGADGDELIYHINDPFLFGPKER